MYCKFCGNRLAKGNNKCTSCNADIDYNDYGQTFYGDEEFVEWQVDENQKSGRLTNMPVTKNLSSMETVRVNLPGNKKKKKKGALISKKNILILSIVAVVVIAVLAAVIGISIAKKDDDVKPAPAPVTIPVTEESVKAINATISEGNKLKLEASPDGLYVAKVFSSDGAVLYYIPLRYYFTNYQGYESWSITDGVMKANKNTKDVKLYLTIDPTTQSVFIASAVSETKEYYGTIYTSDDNEAYIAVEGLASLLGYGSVTYDAEKSQILFVEVVEEAVEAANPEESADGNNGKETDKEDKPKNKEKELTPAQIESKKQAEEEAKKRAEEEERQKLNQGGGVANDNIDDLIQEKDEAPANFEQYKVDGDETTGTVTNQSETTINGTTDVNNNGATSENASQTAGIEQQQEPTDAPTPSDVGKTNVKTEEDNNADLESKTDVDVSSEGTTNTEKSVSSDVDENFDEKNSNNMCNHNDDNTLIIDKTDPNGLKLICEVCREYVKNIG